jgi:hypothetical protein
MDSLRAPVCGGAANRAAFEVHCQRREVREFFATHLEDPEGDIADANVCVYTDEPVDTTPRRCSGLPALPPPPKGRTGEVGKAVVNGRHGRMPPPW